MKKAIGELTLQFGGAIQNLEEVLERDLPDKVLRRRQELQGLYREVVAYLDGLELRTDVVRSLMWYMWKIRLQHDLKYSKKLLSISNTYLINQIIIKNSDTK